MTRRIFCKVLLVVVAVFGLLVLSGVLSAQGRSEDAFDRVRKAQEKHTDILMARPGVVGTAVGLNDDGEYAVLVLLKVPGVVNIPQEIEGVPVQPVVTGEILALSATGRYDRPVPIGVSTGHPAITAGTIGCRVTDGIDVYAISNNHVYANENLANIGDPVIQPGTYDEGTSPADDIGTLSDFEPIVFSRRARNEIDAAIALSSTSLLGTATPAGGYGTPNSTIVGAFIGQEVQKFGRTTELTTGEVTGVNATVNVGYGPGKTAKFVKQIIIEPGDFSAPGDSGSLIVTQSGNNPVGLLFAGSSTVTVANRIDLVLARFNVTVDGEEPTPNDPPTVTITSPTDGSTFDSGATIDFAGTASDTEDGDISASMVWTSNIEGEIGTGGSFPAILSDGNHTITAEATDSGGKTSSDSISITVGTPPAEAAMHVAAIDMWYTSAGPNRFIYTKVTIVDSINDPVSGATVYLETTLPDNSKASGSGDTGDDGTVTFKLKSQQKGTYTSMVTDVVKSGWVYDSDANVETSETHDVQ